MLASVRQTTIRPVIEASVAKGALVHTDEYDVHARLQDWGYWHKTVCHGRGEYARNEDGDGFCEVHVNTAEGFWSLLRSWLRPHHGILQEKRPSISASSSSSTTPVAAARRSSAPSSQACLPRPMLTTPKPDKSQQILSARLGSLSERSSTTSEPSAMARAAISRPCSQASAPGVTRTRRGTHKRGMGAGLYASPPAGGLRSKRVAIT